MTTNLWRNDGGESTLFSRTLPALVMLAGPGHGPAPERVLPRRGGGPDPHRPGGTGPALTARAGPNLPATGEIGVVPWSSPSAPAWSPNRPEMPEQPAPAVRLAPMPNRRLAWLEQAKFPGRASVITRAMGTSSPGHPVSATRGKGAHRRVSSDRGDQLQPSRPCRSRPRPTIAPNPGSCDCAYHLETWSSRPEAPHPTEPGTKRGQG